MFLRKWRTYVGPKATWQMWHYNCREGSRFIWKSIYIRWRYMGSLEFRLKCYLFAFSMGITDMSYDKCLRENLVSGGWYGFKINFDFWFGLRVGFHITIPIFWLPYVTEEEASLHERYPYLDVNIKKREKV